MSRLQTSYLGLNLKNPIIAGSSGLTNSVEKIQKIQHAGAGAVVLKSLFEEQIKHEINKSFTQIEHAQYPYPEAEDYIRNYSKEHNVEEYLKLIRQSKEKVDIPVIASINCVTPDEWPSFAKSIEDAGADALELNVFILPSDPGADSDQIESIYFKIIDNVRKQIDIPISIKISHYFSGLAKTAIKLSWTGIKGLVLFNRFFSPDIDIDNFKITATNVFSSPEEISTSLRWVAMLSDLVHCDISASTGNHDGNAIIKQILAGAQTAQVCSALYKNGFDTIGTMLTDIEKWMDKHEFENIDAFRGKMSYKKTENPAAYERVQFMKHFAGIE